MRKNPRLIPVLLAALTASALLVSCSSGGKNSGSLSLPQYSTGSNIEYDAAISEKEYYDYTSSVIGEAGSSLSEQITDETERKIVKTVSLSMETKEFDSAAAALEKAAADLGGYVQSSNTSNSSYYSYYNGTQYKNARTASYVVRIPAQMTDSYVGTVSAGMNVTSKSTDVSDISDNYYDIEARLDAYKTQETRLLELLSTSSDLQYLLEVEDKLSEVRYNIESLTAKIRRYDSLVSYSTVNITLSEVIEYTPVTEPITFGERMGTAFSESWQSFVEGLGDFTVWLTYAFPTLLVIAVIAAVIILIIVLSLKKSRRRLEKQLAAKNSAGSAGSTAATQTHGNKTE